MSEQRNIWSKDMIIGSCVTLLDFMQVELKPLLIKETDNAEAISFKKKFGYAYMFLDKLKEKILKSEIDFEGWKNDE